MTACRERYKDKKTVLCLFNPSEQVRYTRNLERCFMGHAPTLTTLALAFGRDAAETWLEVQLNNLSEFSGCKDKLSDRQTEEIAQTILATFGFLKLTELMYFFLLFKSGEFGKFYGAVDGLTITSALKSFLRIRTEHLQTYEREEQERQRTERREREKGQTLSSEEWEELRWLFNMGYEPWRIKAELKQQHDENNSNRP